MHTCVCTYVYSWVAKLMLCLFFVFFFVVGCELTMGARESSRDQRLMQHRYQCGTWVPGTEFKF